MNAPHVATVEIARLACRLVCDYAKPALWARELHPGFLTARDPDLTVHVTYDDGYWDQGLLPWIAPDTVPDEPALSVENGRRVVTSTYYRLTLVADDRVDARVAGGFGIGGPLRALYGLLLPERRRLALAATAEDAEHGVRLVCGDPASSGIVAVEVTGLDAIAHPTPFHGGETPERQPSRPITHLVIAGDPVDRVPRTVAETAAGLLPYALTIDRSPGALLRAIDLAAALAGAVPIRGPRATAAVAGAGDRR